jgi:hypothetical protein
LRKSLREFSDGGDILVAWWKADNNSVVMRSRVVGEEQFGLQMPLLMKNL